MADIEIVVFRDGARIASAIVEANGTLLARLRNGQDITSLLMPLGDVESVWGVVERAGEMLSILEITGG